MSKLNYIPSGDYLIPDLKLTYPQQEPLGKYGRLRRTYLQEQHPILLTNLILSEKLYPHLKEIDETASRRLEVMMPKLQKLWGVTEQMKRKDPLKWASLMTTLQAQAEETILQELIYT